MESEERLRRLEELESGGRMGRDVALAMEALAEPGPKALNHVKSHHL